MPRPCKERYISATPVTTVFQPNGIEQSNSIIFLTEDEFEALRLADLLGYKQGESAIAMNISRQTFGRILEHAHTKVADALVNGKQIEIGGGKVVHTRRRQIHCAKCQRRWEVPQREVKSFHCPHCQD